MCIRRSSEQLLGDGLMDNLRYVLIALTILLGGCARATFEATDTVTETTVSNDYDDGQVLFEGRAEDLVSTKDGLTTKGCVLFLKKSKEVCLHDWQKLNYDDKVSFFYFQSSKFIRGLWNYRREQDYSLSITKEEPTINTESLRVVLNHTIAPDVALECVLSGRVHEDLCLLLYEPFASRSETMVAAHRWLLQNYLRTTAKTD